MIISKLCVGLTFYITLCCVVTCLFLCESSKKKETSWCREKTGREVMKQEERLLKRGRGEGIVQVFDETCTFFCACRKVVVPLHAQCVQMGKHGNKTTEEPKSKRDQVGR